MADNLPLTRQALRDALASFASPAPAPGGGSASALASALGASLLLMVAGLPKTRDNSKEDRAALAGATSVLIGVQQQLTEAIDADSAAYEAVVAAYRQRAATEQQKTSRGRAVQRALRGATDVPLGVMRLSIDGLKQAQVVARHGLRAASSDVGVALALLQAGLEGARLNVRVNLGTLADAAYADAVRAESERLTGQSSDLVRDAIGAMG
jgi:formiminotetrahydrofolate cyclodeaminase